MKMKKLIRRRWNAYSFNGIPKWKLKTHFTHRDISFTNERGVICVTLCTNEKIYLDKISRLRKENGKLFCSGFLENENPIMGQMMCYREEWELS